MSGGPEGSDPFSLLVGKALLEPTFRKKVLDPKKQVAALQEVGIANPTKEQIRQLNNSITALENLSGEFRDGVGTA